MVNYTELSHQYYSSICVHNAIISLSGWGSLWVYVQGLSAGLKCSWKVKIYLENLHVTITAGFSLHMHLQAKF